MKALLFVLAAATLLSGVACFSNREHWGFGKVLTVRVSSLAEVKEVTYSVGEEKFRVSPQSAGNVLLVVSLEVHNNKANQTLLAMDERSVNLIDKDGTRYPPLDPYTNRSKLEGSSSNLDKYIPLLWGNFTLLNRHKVAGWMIFEVPKGMKPVRLDWEKTDSLSIKL